MITDTSSIGIPILVVSVKVQHLRIFQKQNFFLFKFLFCFCKYCLTFCLFVCLFCIKVPRHFNDKHNIIALVDPELKEAVQFQDMIRFLRRSRIFTAISAQPIIIHSHIADFWEHAVFTGSVIRSRIGDTPVEISVSDIQEALQFGDLEEDPISVPSVTICGLFNRMGYTGDAGSSQLEKKHLFGQWRYLFHVVKMCLSARKSDVGSLSKTWQSAIVALVLNKPFNFSQAVFQLMIRQIGCKENERFLLYPRFLAIVLDRKLPELVKTGATVRISVMNRRIFADCKPKRDNRQETPLFGHVIDPDYVAPGNDAWMHPEEEEVHSDEEQQPPQPQPQPQPQPLPPPQQSLPIQPPPNQPSPHHSPLNLSSPDVIGSESSDDDDDDDDDIFDDPPVGKDVVRKRAGGVFVNVEKRRRLTDDDLDSDYVPPETEIRQASTSTSIPVPVAATSVPPSGSEFANFPEITEAMFTENLDDISFNLGPSSSQVNSLESQVIELSAKVVSLTEEVERLRKENQDVTGLKSEIDELKVREKEHYDHMSGLTKALSEQMEENKQTNRRIKRIMQDLLRVHDDDINLLLDTLNLRSTYKGESSCNPNEPVQRDDGDKDDDPAPQQPPNAETGTDKVAEVETVTTQGESGSGTVDKGKGKEVADEEDLMFDTEIDVDNVVHLDDVFDFVDDVDKDLKEDEFEMDPCLSDNISEELDLEDGEWIPPKDFAENDWDEFVKRREIELKEAMKLTRSFANPELRKEFEDRTVKKSYKNKTEAVGKILSWAYDRYLDVFIIKRIDGIQYLKRSIRSFNQLPLCELRVLAEERMINNSHDLLAAAIKNNLVQEVKTGVYDYIKPQKLKRIKIPNDIDWITRKPRVHYEYKPVKSLKRIPLRTFGFDITRNLKYWFLDSDTSEAVFVNDEKKEILRMLDPLNLVNFSEDDLLILKTNRIDYHKDHETEAMQFQRVVDVCVEQKIHAGSHLPARWAE